MSLPAPDGPLPGTLDLGAFSMSLDVADLEASMAFYGRLGFEATHEPEGEHRYVIMKNGETTIGLFEGVIEGNVLTFNPGLTNRMAQLEDFTDVREIQQALTDAGVELTETVQTDQGPGHLTLVDPDGNAILIDQFF